LTPSESNPDAHTTTDMASVYTSNGVVAGAGHITDPASCAEPRQPGGARRQRSHHGRSRTSSERGQTVALPLTALHVHMDETSWRGQTVALSLMALHDHVHARSKFTRVMSRRSVDTQPPPPPHTHTPREHCRKGQNHASLRPTSPTFFTFFLHSRIFTACLSSTKLATSASPASSARSRLMKNGR
jgi:hypothetical protein